MTFVLAVAAFGMAHLYFFRRAETQHQALVTRRLEMLCRVA